MKKLFSLLRVLPVAALLAFAMPMQAQGFLKKLSKGLDKVAKAGDKAVSTASNLNEAAGYTASGDSTTVDWAKVKTYTAKAYYETDDNGTAKLDASGNKVYRVFLVDQDGNKVSQEAVKAQIATVNKKVALIAAKVGGGAAVGALLGGGKDRVQSALAGAAAGLGLSVGDITKALALKKDLGRQKRVLEAYQRNFDKEGNPIKATVDAKDLKTLAINLGEATAESTSKIKAELEGEAYNNSTTVLDDLLNNLN